MNNYKVSLAKDQAGIESFVQVAARYTVDEVGTLHFYSVTNNEKNPICSVGREFWVKVELVPSVQPV